MQETATTGLPEQAPADAPPRDHGAAVRAAAAASGAALLLAGCDAGVNPDQRTVLAAAMKGVGTGAVSETSASRFLAQASMGATTEEIARVMSLGYEGWLDQQMALPLSASRWDALVANGYNDIANKNSEAGFDACAWRKMIAAPDTLRQRITLALSEILVVAIDGLVGGGWRQFTAAAYLDMLEANAFGNYRDLLQAVSLSPAMGEYLTYRGNVKYSPTTGALPDENYARELMQLFTIGLVQLNNDGTPRLANGQPQETYGLDDITGLARVFTGWDYDLAGSNTSTPDFKRRPMAQVASRHETGVKTFIGATIAAGGTGATDLKAALDILFAHSNVGPFIGKQLIQRLVTSNPSPGYVGRVAAAFNHDANGVRGNLKAVIKAVLLDPEARDLAIAAANAYGKQREPMLRFVAWARAFNATSASNAWAIGNTTDAATRLGQSPLRSPSVFNFFRPGYVPPNSPIASAGLAAPEFQLTNESSTVGYINYMQNAASRGVGDVKADYSALMLVADDSTALLSALNTVLAAGQLSAPTLALMRGAIGAMPAGSDAARLNRIYASLVLVLAAPEFIILH
jgi:uncharacterized protein (DUF1800 family)